MTRRSLLFDLSAGVAGLFGHAAAEPGSRTEKIVELGDSRVRLLLLTARVPHAKPVIYFHPHENEHGSAVVTRHIIAQSGGRLIEIRSQGERLINFKLKGVAYSFDPNRMFTDAGLESSLAHFAPVSPDALACALKLRSAVLDLLGGGKTPIIAVHNSDRSNTARAFQPKGERAAQAAKVALNPSRPVTDYFVVLDADLFEKLHHAGFNVVLLSANPTDDGSLAVFCRQHRWPYATVEAAENDMSQQQRMIEALRPLIS